VLKEIALTKEGEGKNVSFQVHIPKSINPLNCEIILDIPSSQLTNTNQESLDFEAAINKVKKLPYSDSIKKVVLSAEPDSSWKVNFYVKSNNQVVKV
jgi:hypothetical protein